MASPIYNGQNFPQPVYSNHDKYWMTYMTYLQHTNRQEKLAKWTAEEFDSNVVKPLSDRLGDEFDGQPLCVLGVGSSEGYQEIVQLKKLKTKFSQISATVIEPSEQQISEYQVKVQQKSSDFTGVEYEWHNKTFQEFVKSSGGKLGQKKYHFISIVHAIYYTGEVEETVRMLYEFLQPGGIIFMVLLTEHTGIGMLLKTFPHLALEEQKSTTTSDSPLSKTNYLTNSNDVRCVLNKYQIAYTQSSYIESTDISACYTHKELSTNAKLLLDILTMTSNLKESVPEEIFKQIMDCVKCNTYVKKSNEGTYKYYIDSECDILVISK